eukprot:m.179442 g.179442  ORF g.179442 m.179442 type:complete len:170 (-) comp15477_c0_seq3:1483-1992(-)
MNAPFGKVYPYVSPAGGAINGDDGNAVSKEEPPLDPKIAKVSKQIDAAIETVEDTVSKFKNDLKCDDVDDLINALQNMKPLLKKKEMFELQQKAENLKQEEPKESPRTGVLTRISRWFYDHFDWIWSSCCAKAAWLRKKFMNFFNAFYSQLVRLASLLARKKHCAAPTV